jgi:hypothetical protein
MAIVKKRMMAVITLGVWIAALGSAAALTYNANRPTQVAGGGSQADARRDTVGGAPFASVPEEELESVLYMPDVTIVGKAPHAGLGPRP